ncbi:MAG: 30S ribosomal protein S17 [Candidatus Moranbacteria bacterium]|nr:30S ribosomal protein S17 [Candidatus Moranbacteria bacterium]NTW75643.1 30S ribosomal protein S17 [Candidatus Moranbacteria bacterium]
MATTKQTIETSSKAPTLRGTVTSAKTEKTITVEVKTLKVHPKYGKRYRSSKKYLVHAPEGKYVEGDVVTFRECRPLSSRKRHEVVTDAK